MADEGNRFTDAELADIERWAKDDLQGNLGQQANAKRTLQLVEELRARRLDAARLHFHHMQQGPQPVVTDALTELQATMDRYKITRDQVNPKIAQALEEHEERAAGSKRCRICVQFDSTLPKPDVH